MQLHINGKSIEATPGKSLRSIIQENGLDSKRFEDRPIAAKIAGEIFNLNYIPVRERPGSDESLSIRKAMAASNGVIKLLTYKDPKGKDVYNRTAQFVIFCALEMVYPQAKGIMSCSVGPGVYIEVCNCPEFSVDVLRQQLLQIVSADTPLVRRRISTSDAIAYYEGKRWEDKSQLLHWRQAKTFDQYSYLDFADYYYGELAPSTGYLQVWDILPAKNGFIFVYPDDRDPGKVAHYRDMPNFLSVCTEGEQWCKLMECRNVAELNAMTQSGRIRELIRVNEALHEKKYSQIADMVCARGARAVMLAGPSSSGKTTSALRLGTQLRVHGKKPILLSLDDYYIDRDKIELGADGKLDLEHINTIDTPLFRMHIQQLLEGQEVEIPTFDFLTAKRVWKGHRVKLDERSVMIVEGLHALNPVLLPEHFDQSLVFKLYVSPLLPLNLDDHNRIPTSYLRLLRRTVRDYHTRGSSVARTMEMWDSVRRGEERWIFPFQENADVIFNSSTLYELAVLKKYIYPILIQVQPEEDCYDDVRSVVKILNYIAEADVDDEIPPTSLVREFIGGNTFYR